MLVALGPGLRVESRGGSSEDSAALAVAEESADLQTLLLHHQRVLWRQLPTIQSVDGEGQ